MKSPVLRNITVLLESGSHSELRKRYMTAEKVKSSKARVFIRLTKKGPAVVLCYDVASAIQKHPWLRLLTWAEYDQVKKSGIKETIC